MRIFATVKEQVYESLKNDICNGRLEPGKWLQEQEIATQLNVSRSPVREAFRMLAGDGLVSEIPNKGVFVRKFTQRDIEEIFAVRQMMESYAILHSNDSRTSEHEEALCRYLEKYRAGTFPDDRDSLMQLNTYVHDLIMQMCGNSLLQELYQKVQSMLQPFQIYTFNQEKTFLREHAEIIEALLDGKIEEANALNRTHLTLAQKDVERYISELSGAEDGGKSAV